MCEQERGQEERCVIKGQSRFTIPPAYCIVLPLFANISGCARNSPQKIAESRQRQGVVAFVVKRGVCVDNLDSCDAPASDVLNKTKTGGCSFCG